MAWRDTAKRISAGLGERLMPAVNLQMMGLTPDQIAAQQTASLRQFGLGMLTNIGTGEPFGPGLGRALGAAQDMGPMLAAQRVAIANRREPAYRRPVVVKGADGRPVYEDEQAAIGKEPYMEPQQQNTPGPVNLGAGGMLVDPTGKVLARNPARVTDSEPLVAVQMPDGSSVLLPRSQAVGRQPAAPREGAIPTEGERKGAALWTRLNDSLGVIQRIGAQDKSALKPGVTASIAGRLPLVGPVAENVINSANRQQVEASQLDALDAALTLATGAAYTADQLKNLRKAYFPQIGDTEQTVAEKNRKFEVIVQTARINAGRAVSPQPAAPATPSLGGGIPMPSGGTLLPNAPRPDVAKRASRYYE